MAVSKYTRYKIETGSGVGGFLRPPGHYSHMYSLNEYRGSHLMGVHTLDYIDEPYANASPAIVAEVNRIRQAPYAPSELWVRHVYGYFRNMYVPASGSTNASDLIAFNPGNDAENAARDVLTAAGYKRGGRSILGEVDGFRIAVRNDGSLIHVRQVCGGVNVPEGPMLPLYADALTAAGYKEVEIGSEHVRAVSPVVPAMPDPETHAAVTHIRRYVPDHAPRVDLITNPGKGYGSHPCDTCGERVQYEERKDALCVVTTRLSGSGITRWSYNETCTNGGPHTVTD